MNISSSVTTASRRYPSYPAPYQGGRRGTGRIRRPGASVYYPPQYGYPTWPSYPQPYYPYPFYPRPSVPAQVWHGFTERLQEVTQVALHPFNRYARRMPWDMYRPRTGAENFGRWIVNLGLLGGALVVGSSVLGGGFSLGGVGAAVGMG